MNRSNSLIAGLVLIALGALALLFSLSGVNLWYASWRWWPTVVIGFGALLALLPIFIRKRWMGLIYIIAAPIIATGIMLLISMTSGQWFLWARWWPIGLLSTALGFAIAAVYAREAWLAVPAIVLGVNGGIFLFNMLAGQWYSVEGAVDFGTAVVGAGAVVRGRGQAFECDVRLRRGVECAERVLGGDDDAHLPRHRAICRIVGRVDADGGGRGLPVVECEADAQGDGHRSREWHWQ